MGEELCGSLPRRHRRRRRRSARRRSRSASASESSSVAGEMTVRVDDSSLANQVASLRRDFDAAGIAAPVKIVPDAQTGKPAALAGEVPGKDGKLETTGSSLKGIKGFKPKNGAKGSENPDHTTDVNNGKALDLDNFELNLPANPGKERKSENQNQNCIQGGSGRPSQTFATKFSNSSETGLLSTAGSLEAESMKVIKTENLDDKSLGINVKTDELPKSDAGMELGEGPPLKLSVIEKCVLPVNGMSFKNALENQKHTLPPRNSVDLAKDERKPPVIDRTYSRRNSSLNEDARSRKNSVSKIDSDWRQNLPAKEKTFSRSDSASKERHATRSFSHSKDRYFVRRNSLPREDSASRRNSFSREEPFVRKDSFGKSEFVSRRNTAMKEGDSRVKESVSRDAPFARKNSLPCSEAIPRKNSLLHEGPHLRKSSEPFARRNSASGNGGSCSRRDSFSRDEFSKVNAENDSVRAALEGRSHVNNDPSLVSGRKSSLTNCNVPARKNSWSKDEFHELGKKSLIFENRTRYDKSKEIRPPVENSQPFRRKPSLKDEFTPKSSLDSSRKLSISIDCTKKGGDLHGSPFATSKTDSVSKPDSVPRTGSVSNSDLNRSGGTFLSSPASACGLVKSEKLKCSNVPDLNDCSGSREDLSVARNSIALKNCNEIESSKLRSNSSMIETKSELNTTVADSASADHSESEKIGNFSTTKILSGSDATNSPSINLSHFDSNARAELKQDKAETIKLDETRVLKSADPQFFCPVVNRDQLNDFAIGVSESVEQKQTNVPFGGGTAITFAPKLLNQEFCSENISTKEELLSKSHEEANNDGLKCGAIIMAKPGSFLICNGFNNSRKNSEVNTINTSVPCGNFVSNLPSDVILSSSVLEVCKDICTEFPAREDTADVSDDSTFDRPKDNIDDTVHPAESIVDSTACQWTPTNQVGKRKYSKDFLIKLMELPQCNIAPNLQKSLRECIGKTPGGSGFGGGSSLYKQSAGDQLYPFGKIGHSPGPRGSQHGAYAFQPITKQRSSRGSMKQPNKIQLSLSLHEDVKLKETENAWKPTKLAKNVVDKPSEEKETEELYNKVRSILNKLTPQKLDTLVNQIEKLPINTPDRLSGVIDLIIRKAIDEPNFSEAYAKMCKILSMSPSMNIQNDKQNLDKNQTDFKRVLLNACQRQFNIREKIELDFKEKVAREVKECPDPEKLKELKFQHQEEERKIRMKAAGNCRFIGELFKLDMLRTNIMYYCIQYLIKKTEEEPLESLCKLLTTIGKHYENRLDPKSEQSLDSMMDELARLASKNNKKKKNAPNISSRIRFMIQDVIELRQNKWIPRRDDNTPKTIDQIQKEADREQLETSIALSGSSMKKMDRPRQDDRDRMRKGGRMDGMGMNQDDWQTPKNTFKTTFKTSNYFDPSKLENFRNTSLEMPAANIRLGMARPNIWAQGAVTTKGPQPDESKSKFSARNPFEMLEDTTSQLGLNNSSSNKPSTLDRDRTRDNRNLSQDDEMISKRGMIGGPPAREGSIMRSAPPSIQPPIVPATPKKDDEGLKKSLKSTVEEYSALKDIKEIERTLSEDFVTPACLGKFIDFYFDYFMDNRKHQEAIAPIFASLLDSKYINFTPKLIIERFNDFISIAEDLIIDYPKLWDYIAMILAHTLTSNDFTFDHVRQSLVSILRKETCKTVLSHIFEILSSLRTPVWISDKWRKSNVTLKDFIEENDVDKFVETNKLEYLIDPNAPVLKSSMPTTLSFDDIKSKLSQILRENPDDALVPIQNWVHANWGNPPYNHLLIRPLMTAICEASITGEPVRLDKSAFMKHFKLIQYFVDLNPNLEAHCLYAVSMLLEKLEHPKDLALSFFLNLSEHIMSGDGFKLYYAKDGLDPPANDQEKKVKGVVTLGTRTFWTSLLESLDNSDEEEPIEDS